MLLFSFYHNKNQEVDAPLIALSLAIYLLYLITLQKSAAVLL